MSPGNAGRRAILGWLGAGAAALGAGLVGIPVVGFVLSPLLRKPEDVWRRVGPISEFPRGETVKVEFRDADPVGWSGPAAFSAAWLRRTDESVFVAFAVNCTHLGCTVRWEEGPRFFMCPCHGGVFFADGEVAAGPPEVPLARYPVRVRDGQVEIMTGPIPITGELLSDG